MPLRAWTEPGGISEDMLSRVLWALPSACGRNDPFARRDSSGCGLWSLWLGLPLLHWKPETLPRGGRDRGGAGGGCHLNPFNTVVGRESGTQTPGQMGKHAP